MSCPVAIGALFLKKLRADDLKLCPIKLPRRRYIPPAHPGERVTVIDRSTERGYHELVSDGKVSLESRQDTATGRTTILEVELPKRNIAGLSKQDRREIRAMTGHNERGALPYDFEMPDRIEAEDLDNPNLREPSSVQVLRDLGMHIPGDTYRTLLGRIGAQVRIYGR